MIEYERTNLNGVPDYTAVEFEGRRHDYCLLIPVINEGARILTELGRAQKAGIDQGWTPCATLSSATAAPPTAA